MKRLLSILSTLGIVASASSAVVACGSKAQKKAKDWNGINLDKPEIISTYKIELRAHGDFSLEDFENDVTVYVNKKLLEKGYKISDNDSTSIFIIFEKNILNNGDELYCSVGDNKSETITYYNDDDFGVSDVSNITSTIDDGSLYFDLDANVSYGLGNYELIKYFRFKSVGDKLFKTENNTFFSHVSMSEIDGDKKGNPIDKRKIHISMYKDLYDISNDIKNVEDINVDLLFSFRTSTTNDIADWSSDIEIPTIVRGSGMTGDLSVELFKNWDIEFDYKVKNKLWIPDDDEITDRDFKIALKMDNDIYKVVPNCSVSYSTNDDSSNVIKFKSNIVDNNLREAFWQSKNDISVNLIREINPKQNATIFNGKDVVVYKSTNFNGYKACKDSYEIEDDTPILGSAGWWTTNDAWDGASHSLSNYGNQAFTFGLGYLVDPDVSKFKFKFVNEEMAKYLEVIIDKSASNSNKIVFNLVVKKDSSIVRAWMNKLLNDSVKTISLDIIYKDVFGNEEKYSDYKSLDPFNNNNYLNINLVTDSESSALNNLSVSSEQDSTDGLYYINAKAMVDETVEYPTPELFSKLYIGDKEINYYRINNKKNYGDANAVSGIEVVDIEFGFQDSTALLQKDIINASALTKDNVTIKYGKNSDREMAISDIGISQYGSEQNKLSAKDVEKFKAGGKLNGDALSSESPDINIGSWDEKDDSNDGGRNIAFYQDPSAVIVDSKNSNDFTRVYIETTQNKDWTKFSYSLSWYSDAEEWIDNHIKNNNGKFVGQLSFDFPLENKYFNTSTGEAIRVSDSIVIPIEFK